MAQEVYLVAFEGDDRDVVDMAASHAERVGASLHIAHILEWSPYSFLTPEELEERHAKRRDELSRAKEAVMDPVLQDMKDRGVTATGETRYGSVVDLLVKMAKEKGATMIYIGRGGSSGLAGRIFGSVPIGLAQVAPVPVVIVP